MQLLLLQQHKKARLLVVFALNDLQQQQENHQHCIIRKGPTTSRSGRQGEEDQTTRYSRINIKRALCKNAISTTTFFIVSAFSGQQLQQ